MQNQTGVSLMLTIIQRRVECKIKYNYYYYLLYSINSILQYFSVTNYTHISLEKKKQNNGKSSICLKDLAKNKRTADGADRDIPKQ